MKVLALVGSPRATGNTSVITDKVLEALGDSGIETEKIFLGRANMSPCLGHDDCRTIPACHLHDAAAEVIEKVMKADGIILASPVYFQNVSAQTKIFMDRFRHPYRKNLKSGAIQAMVISIAASSGIEAVADIMKSFLARATNLKPEEMLAFCGCARNIGEAKANAEMLSQAESLGREMATRLTK